MPRLTITLSDEQHRALKESALRRRKTIGAIIGESLERAGIKTEESVDDILARARRRSGLSEAEALRLAVRATRAVRAARSR